MAAVGEVLMRTSEKDVSDVLVSCSYRSRWIWQPFGLQKNLCFVCLRVMHLTKHSIWLGNLVEELSQM